MSESIFSDDSADDDLLAEFPDPRRNTKQYLQDHHNRHTDARSIREYFGIYPYNDDNLEYQNLLPNVLNPSWDAGTNKIPGGTDCLCIGKPGSGKSTLASHFATRAVEVPGAKTVWRASPNRSEWLPLAPWATLCLPDGVDISAEFVPRDPTNSARPVQLDELEEFVREVKYYSNLTELNREILRSGSIHVVYPDPRMRGCQQAYERSDEKAYDDPPDRDLFSSEDPAKHWWFGWVLDRVENGPHDWTTLILDEIGDIAPQSAKKDQFGTYQKIELLRDCWIDARKKGLSIFAFGHSSKDIHSFIRRKLRWRVTMNSKSNPTRASSVVGFDAVPMEFDLTSRMDVGEALIWNEQNFEKFSWPEYAAPVQHKLELRLGGETA